MPSRTKKASSILSRLPILILAFALACTRPPAPPDSGASSQRLPFDHETPPSVSVNQSLIPSALRLSEGTFLTVRLSKPLSSASAHTGDSFDGTLDEPVVVDQQTLLPRGTRVSGRVLDSTPSADPRNPGYLRITLVSLNANGKTILIDTSSIFTKAAPRSGRPFSDGSSPASSKPPSNDALFIPDHRLTFRVAQAVDLQ